LETGEAFREIQGSVLKSSVAIIQLGCARLLLILRRKPEE